MGHPSPRPGLDAEVSYKPRAPGSNRTRGCGIPLLPAGLTRGDGELPHSAALPHRSGLAFTPERGSRAIGDYARPDVTVATFQIIKIYWEANPIYPLYTSRSVEQKPHEPLQAATPEDDAADTALGCAMIIIAMILTGLAVWAGVSYFGDDSDQASQSTAPTSSRSLAPPSKASESPSVAAVQSAPVTSGQVDSLYAATPGEDDVAGMRNTEVFRRSEGFDFLMNPGIVVPGGMYTNATAGNSCSFGWVVTDGTRIFNLTAGHCGKVGDRIIVKDKQGRSHDSGQFVESTGTPKNFGSDPDFALIDITGHEYQFSPPLKNLRFPGVVDLQYLSQNEPYLCRLGWRSGLSCGYFLGSTSDVAFRYRNISDHGDSGGPVFVYDSNTNTALAAGVTSYGSEEQATQRGAAAIKPYLDHFGLTVIGK